MVRKSKAVKGKHAAQKPSKGKFNKGASADEKKFGSKDGMSGTSTWSGKSWKTSDTGTVTYGTSAAAYASSDVSKYKQKRKEKHHNKKTIGVVVGVILAVLVVVYLAGAAYFSSHYYPNSKIGDDDISLMTADEVAQDLTAEAKSFSMKVTGKGLNLTVDASNANTNIDADSVAQTAMDSVSGWSWPVAIFQQHDFSNLLQYAYDGSSLGKAVKQAVNQVNKTATSPQDATIAYNASKGKFTVQKEQLGTKLDYDKVMDKVTNGIMVMREQVTIDDDELQTPDVTSDDSRLQTAADEANGFLKAKITLKMSGTKVAVVNADEISEWITLDDELNASVSKAKMKSWVADLASEVDTVGTKRTVHNSNGGTYTVSGGDYGWSIDQDSLSSKLSSAIEKGQNTTIDIPCSSEGNAYSKNGSDIGTRYVDIDLSSQHAVFYVNGKSVWSADVITGKPDGEHNTPTGVWSINNKESPSTLIGQMVSGTNTPEYETKVSYWMPFVENYIGLHDATWQPSFGGSMYKQGYGSHGCVNLSLSAAGKLYQLIQVGDVVIVHN
ncbi:MAG: L,D-transpeptidase family protein [Eggerthellaceae bacterium]|jgi:lipoprotein-anchoring transpeptidase ErfK/SrfK